MGPREPGCLLPCAPISSGRAEVVSSNLTPATNLRLTGRRSGLRPFCFLRTGYEPEGVGLSSSLCPDFIGAGRRPSTASNLTPATNLRLTGRRPGLRPFCFLRTGYEAEGAGLSSSLCPDFIGAGRRPSTASNLTPATNLRLTGRRSGLRPFCFLRTGYEPEGAGLSSSLCPDFIGAGPRHFLAQCKLSSSLRQNNFIATMPLSEL